jgi:hypothetical protein
MATASSLIDFAYSLIISLLMSVLFLDVPFGYVTHNNPFGFRYDLSSFSLSSSSFFEVTKN